MKTNPTAPRNIDEYIAGFPPHIQKILKKIRLTVRKAAPGAQEVISYQMPAFALNGNLVYFAAFKNHIGIFPPVSGNEKLRQEASVYAGPKGNLQLPLDQPIPYALIGRIVKRRYNENLKKAKAGPKKRSGT